LLQPTSPLRQEVEVKEAISLYHKDIDMVVSVTKSHAPAVLCNENEKGYIELIYNREAIGRQSLKTFYEFNGAIYVINVNSLKFKGLGNFNKRVKYEMPKESSIDIDDVYDFYLVESIIRNNR
jgi:N-acylneuraminate cytidylyltransferase